MELILFNATLKQKKIELINTGRCLEVSKLTLPWFVCDYTHNSNNMYVKRKDPRVIQYYRNNDMGTELNE